MGKLEGVFYAVILKTPGFFSLSRSNSGKLLEEKVDSLYKRYSDNYSQALRENGPLARVTRTIGLLDSGSANAVEQSRVQKYVFPHAGMAISPGVSEVASDLVRVTRPYVHSDKELIAVFSGHLSNTAELQQRLFELSGKDFEGADPASLLLELFRSIGSEKELMLLSELQGQYAFIIYNSSKNQAFAARDPSGHEPLFYSLGSEGGIAFTNTLSDLPAGDHASNWQELAPGHFVSGKTPEIQQFALTPYQLQLRERHESLELNLDMEDATPSPVANLFAKLSRRQSISGVH